MDKTLLPMELKCPLCKESLLLRDLAFYQCDGCGAELWPLEEEEIDGGAIWRSEQAYKNSIRKPSGGSSTSGRKRKKPIKYPPGAAARFRLY